jgi:hypothetical protein
MRVGEIVMRCGRLFCRFGLILLAIASCCASIALYSTTHRRDSTYMKVYEQIDLGWTQTDVEALLGRPPGWYADPGYDYLRGPMLDPSIFTEKGRIRDDGSVEKAWMTNEGLIILTLDQQKKVRDKCFVTVFSTKRSVWDRLRRIF